MSIRSISNRSKVGQWSIYQGEVYLDNKQADTEELLDLMSIVQAHDAKDEQIEDLESDIRDLKEDLDKAEQLNLHIEEAIKRLVDVLPVFSDSNEIAAALMNARLFI